jgi:uncharacterized protein (TIGR02300 family)
MAQVAKVDLGTKRLCPNCGAKYYDLNRNPIICPRCGTQFVVSTGKSGRASASAAAVVEAEEVQAAPEADVEVISLEQADEEAGAGAEESEDGDEVEVAAGEDEDVFLEDEEGGEDDVTDIIGAVDEEER